MLGALARGRMAGLLPRIKQAAAMIRGAQNPEAMLRQMVGNNPQTAQLEELLREAGNDPRRAFYAAAEKYGIDPEEILRMIK